MRLTVTKHFELKDSSIVRSAHYDEVSNELRVTFHDNHDKNKEGETYLYEGVSPDLVDAWKTSKSVGSFFVEYIKDDKSLKCTRVELPVTLRMMEEENESH